MKLLVAIVQDQDSHILIDELMENDFRITKLASTGGFLKSGNTTLLIGLEDDRIPKALELIEANCKVREMTTSLMTMNMPGDGYMPYPVTVKVGGANIFILDIEEYVHF